MSPTAETLAILSTGIVIVVGGILVLRVHPFLALILGAFAVAGLTPQRQLARSALEQSAIKIDRAEGDGTKRELVLKIGRRDGVLPETAFYLWPAGAADPVPLNVRSLDDKTTRVGLATPPAGGGTLDRLSLVTTSLALGTVRKVTAQTPAERVAAGFGQTCTNIAILVAMASIVGKALLDSGAADRVVRFALRVCGESGAPIAFLASGFVLGIPVFFDTVFYLMIPLAKAMRVRTGRGYLLSVLTIAAGATMTHSLVPPTPGPLATAELLGVDMGLMIVGGCIVGAWCAMWGYIYARIVDRYHDIPLRASTASLEELEKVVRRPDSELPPLWLALVPILLPVVLIGGEAILKIFIPTSALSPRVWDVVKLLGDKNVAMTLAAAIALLTVVIQRRTDLNQLKASVSLALEDGGGVILITAAGGAFGGVLQQTGVGALFAQIPAAGPAAIIALAFGVTAAIRTAQGSATVAMITAAGVLAGLAESGQLPFHPLYLALAVGCGSKPFAWMNDSGFWVICRMSGFEERETLTYVSPMLAVMGVAGLGLLIVAVLVWPFPV